MNYNFLMNKPTINYRELIGDNSVTEVGGITEEQFNTLLNTDLSSYYTKAQIDELFARSYVYREKSGSIVTFECPASVNGINKVVSEIVAVQSGTGDPSPENVRPITGWTGCNVNDCGKNFAESKLQGVNISRVGKINADENYSLYFGKVKKGVTYTITSDGEGGLVGGFFETVPQQGSVSYNGERIVQDAKTTTSPIDGYFAFRTSANYEYAQLEVGETATTYEAYNGTTYTTTLKDGQGNPMTCYGGTLLNENGVQTLKLTHGHIASYNGETLPSTWISDRDVYAEGTTPTIGAEVVYLLATPEEIPQDSLAIATQEGTNNIWCDTGDITVKALDKIIQG